MQALRNTIAGHLPPGFEERVSNGMISWNVPLSRYPAGYHCAPGTPLPFVSIASQKNFIAIYHMGIYARPELLGWFTDAWPKHMKGKLDMGKSCIRFKKVEAIPLDLIAELMEKMTAEDWIATYEANLKP
jgi:hypothetical protein